jgi:hypothetical protein
MSGEAHIDGPEAALAQLRAGEEAPEGLLVRCLRSPACPRELVERLAVCRWARSLQRVPALMLRHPGCPRAFAWEVIPRLGWHDLLLVVRDPRTAAPIRRQGERKLGERLKSLTTGERSALARQATRGLIAAMLADEEPLCVQALLANPQFTELDAVRLLNTNRSSECTIAVVRHPRWGATRVVVNAAVRSRAVPLGVVLGLIATLSLQRLEDLLRSKELPAAARAAAVQLLEHRRRTAPGGDGGGVRHQLAPRAGQGSGSTSVPDP